MNAVVLTEAQIYSALIDAFDAHNTYPDLISLYTIPISSLRDIAKTVCAAGQPTEVTE